MSAASRSAQAHVRNPLVLLPAAAELAALSAEQREPMRRLLQQLSADCRQRAAEAWRKHKAPMAAYWKAQAVYARHAALLLRSP